MLVGVRELARLYKYSIKRTFYYLFTLYEKSLLHSILAFFLNCFALICGGLIAGKFFETGQFLFVLVAIIVYILCLPFGSFFLFNIFCLNDYIFRKIFGIRPMKTEEVSRKILALLSTSEK